MIDGGKRWCRQALLGDHGRIHACVHLAEECSNEETERSHGQADQEQQQEGQAEGVVGELQCSTAKWGASL